MSNYGGLITEQEKDYIKSHISYDSDSGRITRDDRKGGLGSKDKDGYLILKIKGKQYKAHRIAWFLFYGEFPKGEIDHINRNKQDNRISNLRIVSRIDNIKNRLVKPNSDTGVIGVHLPYASRNPCLRRAPRSVLQRAYREER